MNSEFGRKRMLMLLLFGLIGQIAWSVENMYFNLFVFQTIEPNLDAITIMVQASGIVATFVTLVAGTLSDKLGNRRSFISLGYIIWGVSVAVFGFISPSLMQNLFGVDAQRAVSLALGAVILGDCIMTLFGSSANDAAFNAWVTDNTTHRNRGKIESILSILPLVAMLIVAGGFGILVEFMSFRILFLILGIVITGSGILGLFFIKDSNTLERNGTLRDMLHGFRPSSVKENKPFYLTLIIMCVYGIACQIFMPYLIIYMNTYLKFSVIEYSVVFAFAIIVGAVINLLLGRMSDKISKPHAMYFATAIFAAGLISMFFSKGMGHTANLILFGISGFVMITGYIYISALAGSVIRDYTPKNDTGKLQGVRMIFCVLIPMLAGPTIGNAINKARNIPLPDAGSADTMTTLFIPAPEIFLAGAVVSLLIFTLVPVLIKLSRNEATPLS